MNGKVLITGGHGNLGSWLTKEFCESGYDVYVLTRSAKTKIPNIQYKLIEADVTDYEGLSKKLDLNFDFCIHTASFNEYFLKDYPKKALDINTLGTRNLLEILSKKKIKRFIYFSTFHIYGINSGIVNENSEPSPKNDYAATHLFAEYYIKQFGATHKVDYTILRLSNSYGAPTFLNTDKWYLVLNDLVKSSFEEGKIIIKSNGEPKRDFIWMNDVTNITKCILENDVNGVYNLSFGKSYKIINLANIVKNVYEERYKKSINIEINNNDKTVYNDLIVDNSKLINKINFKMSDMLSVEVNRIFDLLEKK
jgi:UDP-glucose 4-epimerase